MPASLTPHGPAVRPNARRRQLRHERGDCTTTHPDITALMDAEMRRLAQPRTHERFADPLSEGIAVLEDYGLDVKTINTLEDAGCVYIRDLQRVTTWRLLCIDGFGEAMVAELRRALRKFVRVQEGKC